MDKLNNITIEKNITIKNSEKTCFFTELNKLFSDERKNNFLDNIKDIIDFNEFDTEGDIFENMEYHEDVEDFMNTLIHHVSQGGYGFYNTYSDESEYSPTDPDFRLIDIKKHDITKVEMYIDHIRNGEFEKGDELSIEPILYIDHNYDNVTLQEALFKLLLELKDKDENLYKNLTSLFYTSEENLTNIVKDAIEYRFTNEELQDISYESYVEFYGDVLSKINNNILFDSHNWGDLVFQIPITVNGIHIDAEFIPSTEFNDIEGAIHNVRDILKTAKILEGKGIILNPDNYDGLQNGKYGNYEFDDIKEKFKGDDVFMKGSKLLFYSNSGHIDSHDESLDIVKIYELGSDYTRDEFMDKIIGLEGIVDTIKYGEHWKIMLPSQENVKTLKSTLI